MATRPSSRRPGPKERPGARPAAAAVPAARARSAWPPRPQAIEAVGLAVAAVFAAVATADGQAYQRRQRHRADR